MVAIILASGMGTRLQPLTDHQPKPLVEIEHKPLMAFQIEALQRHGVDECLITTGPFRDQIHSFTDRYPNMDFDFVHNERYAETNYIYSLWLAGERLRDQNGQDSVMVLHGDLVFDPAVIGRLLDDPVENAVVVETGTDVVLKDFGAEIVDGTVQWIGTEIKGDSIQQLYPIYRLSSQTFYRWCCAMARLIDAGKEHEYAEAALNELLDSIDLVPLSIEHFCAEVDTPADLTYVRAWASTDRN